MNIQLVIVDPQNDFCDPKGSLYVPGADEDMKRLTTMISRIDSQLNGIHVTLDNHHYLDISHSTMWERLSNGTAPEPFTILGMDNGKIVKCNMDATGQKIPTSEEYTTVRLNFYERCKSYLEALEANGRYPHVIWPLHCVIDSWGACIVPELLGAITGWEDSQNAKINYIIKGNNIFTEHFSGIKAEVPDPKDPTTQINTGMIRTLEEADIIVLTGEALSHCVNHTGRDIVSCFSDPKNIQKITLLTDASSNVAGFNFLGDAFVQDMTAKGMKLSTTVDLLA